MANESDNFEFAHILARVSECLLRSEVLIKSPKMSGRTKDYIRRSLINRLKACKNDLITIVPADVANVLKQDILSEETALQLTEFTNLFLSLDKSDRDRVENLMNTLKHTQS